jgi:hypothetical protein
MLSRRPTPMRDMRALTGLLVSVVAVTALSGCESRPDMVPPEQDPTLSDPATYPIVPRVQGDPTQPRPTDPTPDFSTRAELVNEETVVLTQYGSSSCPPRVTDAFVVSDERAVWIEVSIEEHEGRMCTADMGPHITEFPLPDDAPMPTEIRSDQWHAEPVPIRVLRTAR